MSKYYKYILSAYILLVLFITIYCLVPKNPFKYYGDEISLETEQGDFKEYNFSNYELNYINNHKLDKDFVKGRKISYYQYNERRVELSDGVYYREAMNDSVTLDSYYFTSQNVILIKAQIPFNLLMKNQYFININQQKVLDWNMSYEYNDKEYDITNFRQSFKPGLFEIVNTYSTRISLKKPMINISIFLTSSEEFLNKSIIFELYQKKPLVKHELTIGLNTLKDKEDYDSVYVLTNYLEKGGK